MSGCRARPGPGHERLGAPARQGFPRPSPAWDVLEDAVREIFLLFLFHFSSSSVAPCGALSEVCAGLQGSGRAPREVQNCPPRAGGAGRGSPGGQTGCEETSYRSLFARKAAPTQRFVWQVFFFGRPLGPTLFWEDGTASWCKTAKLRLPAGLGPHHHGPRGVPPAHVWVWDGPEGKCSR